MCELVKLMQKDEISYAMLTEKINEKKQILNEWISPLPLLQQQEEMKVSSPQQQIYSWGPSLAEYIKLTEDNSFGAFTLDTSNRQNLEKQCCLH
ncbi:unnamed protein product, partial [Didymodactylos carnosus]